LRRRRRSGRGRRLLDLRCLDDRCLFRRCRTRAQQCDRKTTENVPEQIHTALYLVATPIGNLEDITLRALNVLRAADVVAAEDTRRTRALLSHHSISARLLSLHAHNEARVARKVVGLLEQGKSVAFVSDAGTPAINDPGAELVREVRSQGFPVVPVPGANAAVTAFSASGLKAPRVLLCGFLPRDRKERRDSLAELKAVPAALVFYEAPHRIAAALGDMVEVLGADRRTVIARELTKLYESFFSGELKDALEWVEKDEVNRRGEFVVIVDRGQRAQESDDAEARRVLAALISELPLKQAASLASEITGANKKKLYTLGLALKSR
jgi:16S rRNA (cytidine1402-2'-O)-methyltransferase